ncbi:MAG: hypothetical protein Salg2KO_06300 [Salibacteraceae bacterium]
MGRLGTQLNKLWVGLIAGMIGPWIGAFLFYMITFSHKTLGEFVHNIVKTPSTHSALISISLLFNLVFFYLALRQEWYKATRGVITAVFIYAPFIVYFKYIA